MVLNRRNIFITAVVVLTLAGAGAEFAYRMIRGEVSPVIRITLTADSKFHGKFVCLRENYKHEWLPESKKSEADTITFTIDDKFPTALGIGITSADAKESVRKISVSMFRKDESGKRTWEYSGDEFRKWAVSGDDGEISILPPDVHYRTSLFQKGGKIINWPGDGTIVLLSLKSIFFGFYSLPVMVLFLISIIIPRITGTAGYALTDLGCRRKWFFIPIIIIAAVDILYAAVVFSKNSYDFSSLFFYVYAANFIVRDIAVFILLSAAFPGKISRALSSAYLALFILLSITDLSFYYYGFIKFQKIFLGQITLEGIRSFAEPASIAMCAILVAFIAFSVFSALRIRYEKRAKCVLLSVLLLFVVAVDFPSRTMHFIAQTKLTKGAVELKKFSEFTKGTMDYAFSDVFSYFACEIFFNECKTTFTALTPALANEYARYGIDIAEKKYEPVHAPFRKIIVIAMESIRADFFEPVNPTWKFMDRTFLADQAKKGNMFTNFYTTSFYSLEGVTSILFGHPNSKMLIESRFAPTSLAKILNGKGFKTVNLRSTSLYYGKENEVLSVYGFDQIIGKENFEKDPEYSKYVYWWGLCDRYLYKKLISTMDQMRNDSYFILVQGIDTHSINGREDYKDIAYPKVPDDLDQKSLYYQYAKALYYADYDVSSFLSDAEKRGLIGDDTLIIVTADHSCPLTSVVQAIPGTENDSISQIPLIFRTKTPLPKIRQNILSSQVDLAPTILHLAGFSVPAGMWGESLFSKNKKDIQVSVRADILNIRTPESNRFFPVNRKDEISRFFSSVVTN
jgi:phosphoglycerol transferase MdoB-like AlkP superfamily enzyme